MAKLFYNFSPITNILPVVFGGLDGEEHGLVPMLKLIDFGSAQGGGKEKPTLKPKSEGTPTQRNIYAIGKVSKPAASPL